MAARLLRTHELKTWPDYFEAIWNGEKTFELRKDDRDFQVGDTLKLLEYDPETKTYSGRFGFARISYILRDGGHFGLAEGYAILGTRGFVCED